MPRLSSLAFGLLVLIVISLGLMQPSTRVGGSSVQLTEIVFICLLPVATFLAWRNRASLRVDPAVYPVGFYLTTLFVATVFSPTIFPSVGKFTGVCYLALLALSVPASLRDRIDLAHIVRTWIVVSTLVSTIGLIAAG